MAKDTKKTLAGTKDITDVMEKNIVSSYEVDSTNRKITIGNKDAFYGLASKLGKSVVMLDAETKETYFGNFSFSLDSRTKFFYYRGWEFSYSD